MRPGWFPLARTASTSGWKYSRDPPVSCWADAIVSTAGTHCQHSNGTARAASTSLRRGHSTHASAGPAKNCVKRLTLPPSAVGARNVASAAAAYTAAPMRSAGCSRCATTKKTAATAMSNAKAHGS